jgi:hypothetical protein
MATATVGAPSAERTTLGLDVARWTQLGPSAFTLEDVPKNEVRPRASGGLTQTDVPSRVLEPCTDSAARMLGDTVDLLTRGPHLHDLGNSWQLVTFVI